MQEENAANSNARPQPQPIFTPDSHVSAFLLATFFLIAPIVALLTFAAREERRHPMDDYLQAVNETSQADGLPVSHTLASINLDHPITVVTWTLRDRVPEYHKKNAPEYKDTWVTIVPQLKSFCQEYVRTHGPNREQLSARLKQRLGLPLSSNYDTFVEMTVDPKEISNLFRPCGDPSTNTDSCEPMSALSPKQLRADLNATDPKLRKQVERRYWFFNNYYRSFASSKGQYPWTGLGYTFDWARKDHENDMIRVGESEFVIPAEAPIKFESAVDTLEYCAVQ